MTMALGLGFRMTSGVSEPSQVRMRPSRRYVCHFGGLEFRVILGIGL